jgi:hypothetical protein
LVERQKRSGKVVRLAKRGRGGENEPQVLGRKNACGNEDDGVERARRRSAELIVGTKQGLPVYTSNPSVPAKDQISRPRRSQIGNDRKGLVFDEGTGEIIGRGGAILYEWEEVDKERFVKLFLAGLKQASGLSKAGLAFFEVVYDQMRENPNSDRVMLSLLDPAMPKIPRATYFRGLRELLEKEFLFRSPFDGVFFVNIRYMFNGDRLAFVKGYHLKGSQPELPLPPPEPRDSTAD